ncbi:MAG: MbcA/ParS/Xre antitoxin family protein [Pseudomonadota bacterium]|nr:MbcA/ParS/Xre antitoxin family protein [Pseudomonadota bacterium]
MSTVAQPSPKLDRKAMSPAALRAFFRIAALWGLDNREQMTLLGLSSPSTFFKWKRDPEVALPRDALERISYVLGIYKALQMLLPDQQAADAWVRKPNAAMLFGGNSALERMLSGNVSDLFVVRQYLDVQRGGWA